MGRGRLTREAKLRKERPCRGTILSTGETMLEGEASVLSRMLVLEVPPWEHRDPDGKTLAQADMQRQFLPGFTVQFAKWIAQQVEEHELQHRLSYGFGESVKGSRDKLKAAGIAMANTGRVVQNWAVLVSVYRLVREFLMESDADDVLPGWQDVIIETVQTVREERASEVFLDLLGQLIAGGQAVIENDMRTPREVGPGQTVVGYRDAQFVYLLPEIAFKEVTKVQSLRFTVSAIGSQLREDGYLVPGNSNSHLTVQMRTRDGRVRLWRLKAQILTGDSGDVATITQKQGA
jgi:hypothetical protein